MKILARVVNAGVLLVVGAGVYVFWSFSPPGPVTSSAENFVISGVTVINPGGDRTASATLRVEGDTIAEVSGGDQTETSGSLSFEGAYLLPGLVDMHTHLPPATPLQLAPQFMLLYLAHGVTAVRGAGDVDGTANATAREGIANGTLPGPRLFTSGAFVTTGEARWPNSILLSGPEDAAAAVEGLRAEGNTNVKSYENLSVEMIRAVEAAAAAAGMGVLGHVPESLAYEEALIQDVQHFLGVPHPDTLSEPNMIDRMVDWRGVDEARLDSIVAVTLEHGIANTPTLVSLYQTGLYEDYSAVADDAVVSLLPRFYSEVVWHPERGIPVYRGLPPSFFEQRLDALAKKKRLVKKLHDAGAQLYLGTDTQQPFVVPGAGLRQEMGLFEEAGVPLEAIWRYGTADAGESLGLAGLGVIQQGAPADFLIFGDDPTQSLAALETLQAVVVRGKLYRMGDIEAKLAEYQAHYEAFPEKQLAAFFAQRAVDKAAGNFVD